MSPFRIYAAELEACFKAHAAALFGYACVLTRGNRALAENLVQAGFEAAAPTWHTLRRLTEQQRVAWLRTTVTHLALKTFRPETALRDMLPQIEPRYGNVELAYTSIMLERCWQIIKDMPERQHAVFVLHYGPGLRLAEIAAVLGMTEKTVSVHLTHSRRRLLAEPRREHPFGDDDGQGSAA